MPGKLGEMYLREGTIPSTRVWRSTSIAFGVLGGLSLVVAESMAADDWSWLGLLCGAGLLVALPAIVKALREGPRRALTDHPLILVAAFSVYFLFGPLLLVIGPEVQASYSLSWYPTNAKAAVIVTAVNMLGLAILLFSVDVVPVGGIERSVSRVAVLLNGISKPAVFWTFLLIGSYFSYLETSFDLYTYGVPGVIISGTIRSLSYMLLVVIVIGVMHRGRGRKTMLVIVLLIVVIKSSIGLIMFDKSGVLLPWIVLLFGAYLRKPSFSWILLSIVVAGIGVSLLSRPILDARIALPRIGGQGPEERWSVLREALTRDSDGSAYARSAGAWVRLSYTVTQVAAMDLYDRGQGGDDLQLVGWVLLPRFVFPEKPVITRSGANLYQKVTGNQGTSVGPGLFVDGYYNLGWLGVVAYSAFAGVLLALFSAVSRTVVASRCTVLLPIPLLGTLMAFRVDGHFISDFWGRFAMVMVPFLLLAFLIRAAMPVRYRSALQGRSRHGRQQGTDSIAAL